MPTDWNEILKTKAEIVDFWRQAAKKQFYERVYSNGFCHWDRYPRRIDQDIFYWPTTQPSEKSEYTSYEKMLVLPPLFTWREPYQWTISGWRCEGNVCQYGSDGPITNLLIRVHVPMDGPYAGCGEHWKQMPIPESLRAVGVGPTPTNTLLTAHRLSCDWKLDSNDPRRSEWRMTFAAEALSDITWSGEHRDLLIEACRLACWEIVKRYQGESLQDAPQMIGTGGRRITRL